MPPVVMGVIYMYIVTPPIVGAGPMVVLSIMCGLLLLVHKLFLNLSHVHIFQQELESIIVHYYVMLHKQ